ncbi:MAG: PEP-CTERM sorting domain-containing protein [Opitutaceae bacterium]
MLTVAVLSPQLGSANTTYIFTGENFDTIFDSPAVPGTYTTAMSINGSFETASALPASFSGVVTPLTFSFTDGRTVFSNPFPGTTVANQFMFTTDAGGNIADWNIQLAYTSGVTTFNLLSSTGVANASITNPGGADTTGIIKVCTGIWCTVTPMPEPSTYAMMLVGLGLLGFVVRRSKLQPA